MAIDPALAQSLPRTAARVDAVIADRSTGLGLQLYVEHRGHVLADVAAGDTIGGPLERSHLHNVYCATKPLLPLAIAQLVEQGELDLDRPVSSILGPGHPVAPGWAVTTSQVLCHAAGLARPSAMMWRMRPPQHRMQLLDFAGGAPAAEYSELVGWLILEALVERLSGVDASTFLARRVIEPLGLEDGLILDAEARLSALLPRVRVPFGGLPDEAIPLLSERIPNQVVDLRPAFGGLATMSALGALYTELGRAYRGETRPGLPSGTTLRAMLARRRGWMHDPILDRDVDFGGGFMVDIGRGRFDDGAARHAFGHTAGMSNTVAFHDPDVGLSMSLYINGVILQQDAATDERRRMVAAVYRDLKLVEGAT